MKLFLIAATVFLSLTASQAKAVTEIACWDMYAKTGAKPILKAGVFKRTSLTDVQFNLKDERFEGYFIDRTDDSGELWGHKPAFTKSEFVAPVGDFDASAITTSRSPYKGNNEYIFALGSWSFKAPYIKQQGEYGGRLVLPADLSPVALKAFRIRVKTERSNAVLIYDSAHESHQSGQNFLRMFCVSK
jgi:hypothetical protein